MSSLDAVLEHLQEERCSNYSGLYRAHTNLVKLVHDHLEDKGRAENPLPLRQMLIVLVASARDLRERRGLLLERKEQEEGDQIVHRAAHYLHSTRPPGYDDQEVFPDAKSEVVSED